MERSHRQNTDASAPRNSTSHSHRTSSPLPDHPLSNQRQQSPQQRRPHPQTSGLHLPPIPSRFAGDGFDYRRPVMSTAASSSASNVIDLTSDDDPGTRAVPPASTRASRPPRFPREIIDLCDDEPPDRSINGSAHGAPSSPEVEFISARPVEPPRDGLPDRTDLRRIMADFQEYERRGGVNRGLPRMPQPAQASAQRRADRILNERASVQGTRRVRPTPRSRVPRADSAGNRIGQMAANLTYLRQAMGGDPEDVLSLGNQQRLMPGLFNYTVTAFDLGGQREVSPPTYKAPEPAGPGFTRSPEENEVLICPNCNVELCDGDEGSRKRQVWVVKACGHAYCGECTFYRGSSKRKGKDPARLAAPFQKCVVTDCGKKCKNPSAMIQLFL